MIPPHGDIIVDDAIVDDTTHDGTIHDDITHDGTTTRWYHRVMVSFHDGTMVKLCQLTLILFIAFFD